MKRIALTLIFVFFGCFAAQATEINGIQVEVGEGGEHVALHLTGRTHYKVFRVEVSPPRVAVDLENTRKKRSLALTSTYQGRLIKDIRFGIHDATTSRLVMDLSQDSEPQHVQLLSGQQGDGYWLEFDLPYDKPALHGQNAPPKHRHEAAAKPRRDTKPMIIIDAGHGGQDPGTSGVRGTDEKDLTLRYAWALRDALLRTGRYHVTLTRNDDSYLLLRERVRKARAAHGDLFISLHADSAPTRFARGLSVYTISEKSSDKESETLAAQENRADIIGGVDLSGASDDVAGILIDLTERETRAKSAEFADLAIKYLGQSVGLLSNTHRFAGFAVLKAPDIPSVLVEIGFLTNPAEESQLKSRSYEAKVVHGLMQAIDAYFGKNNK